MRFGQLFHVAIKAADLAATVRFYTEVLGMVEAERPDVGFPGAWLKPTPHWTDATFHLYAGEAAREPDGSTLQGGAAIDHVSIMCDGYEEFRGRFERFQLPYRENLAANATLWQLFVHDPNGIQLELTFHAATEHTPRPLIPPQRAYRARERWFDARAYDQFIGAAGACQESC